MFVREKTVGGYTYLYLVENVRENGRAKQRIIKNLGRKEAVPASGDFDRPAASVGRHALLPMFEREDQGSDWNDLRALKG